MPEQKGIPIYSLDKFKPVPGSALPFQIEVFDANRHFEVLYPHRHDFFEVLFLTHGSGIHVIDSNEYEIKPPCVFFLSPGQTHKLELSNDIAGYIFLFTAEFYLLDRSNKNKLLEYPFFFNLNQENPPLALTDTSDVAFLTALFRKGAALMQEPEIGEFANSLLDLILNTCERLYPHDIRAIEKGKGHMMVKRLRKLIEEKYHQNLSIKEYAELLHVSENHLTHIVRDLTGKTSKQLIIDKQILEIKRLLKHSDLTATEISQHLNFSDTSYFSKFFKKQTGLTPNEYRDKSLKST
ncbi:helix-turn-helix transcriptional regulator [Marinoscillum furvescens]|uniref:AraC family transcriptional regulator n=1 Tax=Marinoscillum furvescens DSM 4134 TaxID=1122208 RepID=A0A3D9L2E2_MARFU|nr:AraC family transcriptional regulator [Marinoscillum furvescens]RED96682.1 AraC family transcriptional regulator [Marinoscillum furvescens DSM 4134]